MGNQQEQRVHFQLDELYTSVMKDADVLLFVALAGMHQLNLFKSDTKQAFLNDNMCEEKIYIPPLDWSPEKVPHGYALQLMKSLYGTRRPHEARRRGVDHQTSFLKSSIKQVTLTCSGDWRSGICMSCLCMTKFGVSQKVKIWDFPTFPKNHQKSQKERTSF